MIYYILHTRAKKSISRHMSILTFVSLNPFSTACSNHFSLFHHFPPRPSLFSLQKDSNFYNVLNLPNLSDLFRFHNLYSPKIPTLQALLRPYLSDSMSFICLLPLLTWHFPCRRQRVDEWHEHLRLQMVRSSIEEQMRKGTHILDTRMHNLKARIDQQEVAMRQYEIDFQKQEALFEREQVNSKHEVEFEATRGTLPGKRGVHQAHART